MNLFPGSQIMGYLRLNLAPSLPERLERAFDNFHAEIQPIRFCQLAQVDLSLEV